MKRHHKLLKLIYAGFTTQELHKIYNVYYSFDLNMFQLKPILRQILNCNERTLDNKLTKFQNLKSSMLLEELESKEITPLYFDSETYPKILLEIYDYPFILFTKGNINILNYSNALAIVGSRDATNYTANALDQIVPELIKNNIFIVSGLAKGADNYAHLACNFYGGHTIGVLAYGHDFVYPAETALIRKLMEKNHIVISEYPPSTPIQKFRFPERNRIISGLAQGVLITEAKERSGSLITLDQGLEQDRNIYCLPGPINHELSSGCNKRIKEGAKLVQCAQDILEDYSFPDISKN
ncbi:DNA-processing protein DprA [Macrococcoides canis]|uniref:DNA-processing protein DprA n=1 Tax=Macrococcoides canis TaxID=1855823 RepID=UPI0020B6FEE0|nr:DNA-processing protein DprA [Macrococcus canis]UTH01037.1 DNA-processing protein DprA [Macrococcus canis]WBF51941.1 DNA-processing protein DprA [Macrococcus canis]